MKAVARYLRQAGFAVTPVANARSQLSCRYVCCYQFDAFRGSEAFPCLFREGMRNGRRRRHLRGMIYVVAMLFAVAVFFFVAAFMIYVFLLMTRPPPSRLLLPRRTSDEVAVTASPTHAGRHAKCVCVRRQRYATRLPAYRDDCRRVFRRRLPLRRKVFRAAYAADVAATEPAMPRHEAGAGRCFAYRTAYACRLPRCGI